MLILPKGFAPLMVDGRVGVGILLLLLAVLPLSVKYLRAPKPTRFRLWGWAGLAITLLAELLLLGGLSFVRTFFIPIVWTGYLLLIDSLVWSLRGHSRLGSAPRQFFSLAFWSVPLWLIFEAYNLRLENWTYVGLPQNLVVRSGGYIWSFATIWPAILETADFVEALGFLPAQGGRRIVWRSSTQLSIFCLGLVFVTVPILVPAPIGRYLFGAVWVGFALLLDPINYHWKGRSLLRDLEAGRRATLYSLVMAGLVCGILWEFWNYWAGAKWLYVFPILQQWKIFEMPLPGYLGFPAFAVECFVMFEFLGTLRRRLFKSSRSARWQAAGS
jgi:hypothetical protein